MTELDGALIRRKLSAMRRNLMDLEQVAGLTLAEYRRDRFRLKGAVASDYRESFLAIGRASVITTELAEQLAPSAGLRNRLVHEYDEIDDQIVLQSVGTALDQYGRFIAAIEKYLAAGGV